MKITISGIKSLKSPALPIDLNKMTVITGQNSSGKTSFTLGLKLLSQNLKKNKLKESKDLFEIILDPSMVNPTLQLGSISNKSDLIYRLYFGENKLEHLELIWKYGDNNFSLSEFNYFTEGAPVLIRSFKQHTSKFGGSNLYNVHLLLGNLGPKKIEKICKAILFLIELQKDDNYNFKLGNLRDAFFYNTIGGTFDRSYFEELYCKIYESESQEVGFDMDFIELVILCAKRFPKTAELQYLIEYLRNGNVCVDVLNKLGLNNDREVLHEIKESILQKNVSEEFYMNATISDEPGLIVSNLAAYLLGIKKLDETKKYLEEAEGYAEIEQYISPSSEEENGEYYTTAQLDKDKMLCRFHLMCFDWIESKCIGQLNKIEEIQFESELHLEQKEYFLSTDNSSLFNASKFFFKKDKNIFKPINDLLKTLEIGNNIEIDEHLEGNGYMIFITNTYNERVNIGNLGSGHFYIIRLILLLFKKINERYLPSGVSLSNIIYNSDHEFGRIYMVLTEPEINLHPNLQSSLSNLLVVFNKHFNVDFLIETHSEYLIRDLQLNVAKKNILHTECKLYFFENLNGSTQIRRIRIDKNGFLLDKFGSGFLDQSQKKIEELFKIKQN